MTPEGDGAGKDPARTVSFATPPASRPPLWRDVRVLKWVFQLGVVGAVAMLLGVLVNNVRANSARLGIPTGFDYLDQPAQLTIPGNDMRASQPVREAILQGTLNTLRVVIAGIVLATVIGILIGIARLSGNWLLRNSARVYVEIIRNVPLLLIVIFSYLAFVITGLPTIDVAWEPLGIMVISNRGAVVPWHDGSNTQVTAILLAALIVAVAVGRLRVAWTDRRGGLPHAGFWGTLTFIAAALILGRAGGVGLSVPVSNGRPSGGIVLAPEYFALLVALVVYTASHIAEIVRGSIQAVPKGQNEAAQALALTPMQRMWKVVLPQAMRIAVPPIGNQYLNLLKNSSLGFAISYFELTKVTSVSIGNARPAVPSYLLLIAIYLVFSVALEFMVNLTNRRLALVQR
ncbi:MAG: ABC transporter permease subunit [Actinomycetota bacterium]